MVSPNLQKWLRASLVSALLMGEKGVGEVITDDTFFYGQSPPVYPSPSMPGSSSWSDAYAKATALVAQMTPEERANITVGHTPTTGCGGETGSVPRLNFPGLCLADAANGLRNTDFVNGWSGGLHVGATWNRNLSYERALHMGGEFRRKGVNVMLGPVVGPVGRVAEGGRNWEGFSSDPYLCGQLAYETVLGVQDASVTAVVKHFIGNEQELHRTATEVNTSLSSNIDDKTMHELYLWPFQDTVKAGAAGMMCSYNRLNNSYGCQNSHVLNGLLKTELGFEGFLVSDWGAQHSGVASAQAGMDLVMPNSNEFWGPNGENLVTAVNNGSMEDTRLSDMAIRIVASWYQLGQDNASYPEKGIGLPKDLLQPHVIVDARDPASKSVILNSALEGHVLVKNVNNALPLNKPKLLSVFGYDAAAPPTINPSGGSQADKFAFGYDSIHNYPGFLLPGFETPPAISINGTLTTGGGSGANANMYVSAPLDAIIHQAYEDGTQVMYDTISGNPFVAAESDACLVFINAFATEGGDRPKLYDDYSDALVINVAEKCNNTMVIIHNAGIRLVDVWADHPNVTAIMYAHLPGQDSGRAVTQLLYGMVSPSGKLPYTVAKNETDYNVQSPEAEYGDYVHFPQSNFSEGVYIDYKDFDQKNIAPRYEFGFGLSYTTFEFSDLKIESVGENHPYLPPNVEVLEGGMKSIWDIVAKVSAVVHNTGSVDAMEVAQLYVGVPGGPSKQLRGFNKVAIPAGQSATVDFELTRRDLSEWGVNEQSWVLQEGCYKVFVGSSSRNLPLTGSLDI
ncbi:hypothetical protein HYFRA_00005951 [Hymenoscyphus fraxineus]|uniref:beta-glucosidase n=1 Tax=Hymenoscyphus fraxineus TaxID=746836 RepID=A0A9N9KXC4_9HELO|nr:hypothetical protein HYFRA_00005951 [Hymenoscyphus fraxineus]